MTVLAALLADPDVETIVAPGDGTTHIIHTDDSIDISCDPALIADLTTLATRGAGPC